MSDYSYAVVTVEPPRPRVGPLLWLRSWIGPVEGWTTGCARSLSRPSLHALRREWRIERGRIRKVGIDHSCGDTKTCRCATSRQFRPESQGGASDG